VKRKAPVAVLGLAEAVLAKLQERPVSNEAIAVPAADVVADEERRTLFTPGFMATDDLLAVAEGIERLADRLAGVRHGRRRPRPCRPPRKIEHRAGHDGQHQECGNDPNGRKAPATRRAPPAWLRLTPLA